jgi:hypothetical protein
VLFVMLVISMQIALGIWQLVKYLTQTQYRHVGIHCRNVAALTHWIARPLDGV